MSLGVFSDAGLLTDNLDALATGADIDAYCARMAAKNVKYLAVCLWDEWQDGKPVEGGYYQNQGQMAVWRPILRAHGISAVGWTNPREDMSLSSTAAAAVARKFTLDAMIFDTEDNFEYTKGGGTAFARMGDLMKGWRAAFPHLMTAITPNGRLDQHDGDWIAAYRAKCRCLPQVYGITEGWPNETAEPCATGALLPQVVAGWSYRAHILGLDLTCRVDDDGQGVTDENGKKFRRASTDPADRRLVSDRGQRVGTLRGFFPGEWVKPMVAFYRGPRAKELLAEVEKFQNKVASIGAKTRGWSGYMAQHLTDADWDEVGLHPSLAA